MGSLSLIRPMFVLSSNKLNLPSKKALASDGEGFSTFGQRPCWSMSLWSTCHTYTKRSGSYHPQPENALCVCVCVCVLCSSWGAFEETFQLNVFRTFHYRPSGGRLSLDFRPVECFSLPCRFYSTMASSTDVGHRFWSSGLFVFPTTSTPTRTPQHKPHCSNSLPE